MTKWRSNIPEFLESSSPQVDFIFNKDEATKTLGVLWNPNVDSFQFAININFNFDILTKRRVLSSIAQVFDPLGLIGPIVTKSKLIMQHLWVLKIGWDQPIPLETNKQFIQYFLDLKQANKISIPRHVLLSNSVSTQLHGFTDAPEKAYGVCLYVRSLGADNSVSVRLL